jgi:hypothetical protein
MLVGRHRDETAPLETAQLAAGCGQGHPDLPGHIADPRPGGGVSQDHHDPPLRKRQVEPGSRRGDRDARHRDAGEDDPLKRFRYRWIGQPANSLDAARPYSDTSRPERAAV